MATVVVTFFKPAEYEGFGVIGEVRTSESLTSSGTSGQTTITSLAGEIARVVSSGGAVHVLTGTNPTADTDDLLLTDGGVEYFYMNSLEKIAVIDAA